MTNQILISWCDDDVHLIAPRLTKKQVSDVLEYIELNHDADVGINWGVLQGAIIELFGNEFIGEEK
jgi:hypothetical protein